MTPQTESKQSKQPQQPEVIAYRRLSVVYFSGSVVICGQEMDSASVASSANGGQRPGNAVDSIALAWLELDGSVDNTISVDGQRTGPSVPSDGLVFRKRITDAVRNVRISSQTFVPWSRVRTVAYGPD